MRERRSRKRNLVIVVVIIVVIVVGSIAIVTTEYTNSKPAFTLTANLKNPHAAMNFTYGFMSPNLWGMQKGKGNVTMSVYKNGSVHTVSNLSGVSTGNDNNIVGYPSIHFTHNLPLSVDSAISENLSSFVSFSIINGTPNLYTDVAYDLFLGQGTTLTDEVMVFLYNNYKTSLEYGEQLGSVGISTIRDGIRSNVTWNFYENGNTPWLGPLFVFVPASTSSISATYLVDIAGFLSFLEKNSYISHDVSIVRCGIGSEFGSELTLVNGKITQLANYSFWMKGYFILDNTRYQII